MESIGECVNAAEKEVECEAQVRQVGEVEKETLGGGGIGGTENHDYRSEDIEG